MALRRLAERRKSRITTTCHVERAKQVWTGLTPALSSQTPGSARLTGWSAEDRELSRVLGPRMRTLAVTRSTWIQTAGGVHARGQPEINGCSLGSD
ncbi:hypothetical protein IRJ41_006025 [Triplophysa rosa]|uniref:Uncharacterized protein n=1 Tax=Triplophysa rosa TaxID=992332 RepID=A0A9W7TQG3_TRIRA|nr:hypothetical protein IRJ41_006025 [Triplophysa rosa]